MRTTSDKQRQIDMELKEATPEKEPRCSFAEAGAFRLRFRTIESHHRLKVAAAESGLTMNTFILLAIREKIEADSARKGGKKNGAARSR